MKKRLAILLIAILSFNTSQVSATEEPSDTTSFFEDISDNAISDVSDSDIPAIDTDDSAADSNEGVAPSTEESPSAIDSISDTLSPDENSLVSPESDTESESDSSDITKSNTDISDDEKADDALEDLELIDDSESEKEHIHEYVYKANGDGTHTVTCTGLSDDEKTEDSEVDNSCSFESIENCTFDENNVCIYCGYEKEPEFNPSISIVIENKNCTIGQNNPVIRLYIYQKSYSIEYVQVCFANNSANKYINVALTQGKYYDPKTESYVAAVGNNWYACPNIDYNYATGKYSMRSIYIRTTDGDVIHYSVESKTLEDKYTRNVITVNN